MGRGQINCYKIYMGNIMEDIFIRLQKSKFRSSFHLSCKDKVYIDNKGLKEIRKHAYDFVKKRLARKLVNDGKQTPMKGHPVFIAQHATATCCRKCLKKWHYIDENKELNTKEIDYIVDVIMTWINKQI